MAAKVGNTTALKHGGAGAERRLSTGEPFIGVARDAELAVRDELEVDGVVEIYRTGAARLQAASDLYWQAIQGAPDLDKLDRLMARWGWLQASALRAWLELSKMQKDDSPINAAIVLEAVKNDKRE